MFSTVVSIAIKMVAIISHDIGNLPEILDLLGVLVLSMFGYV